MNFNRITAPVVAFLAASVALSSTLVAQITSNAGDGVMHAPYHGTITALREATSDIGYGEVRNHVEPVLGGSLQITDANLQVWVVGTWDRSVLRFFRELDASGAEVNLTGTSPGSPALVPKGPHTFTRLSFKAIGANTLGPQRFTVHFRYNTTGGLVDVDRTFTIAATTGSFCALPGLSEAFHLGTPILDVSVGNARLTVPVGRTAEMIGAAFIDNLTNIGNNSSAISRRDCLLPGAAETLFIMNSDHFQTTASATGPNKTNYGTPWAGHLTGYRTDSLILGPDATRYDSLTGNVNGLRRIDYIRPFALAQGSIPSQRYNYDGSNRVIEIRDFATPANVITLTRTAGVVTRITTSDGRGWDLQNEVVGGWITGIEPDSGQGARFFSYNTAGRVTQVRDANNDVLYEFTYNNDAQGYPTVLNLEERFVDGSLQTAVEHEVVSASLHRRKEYVAAGQYRQYDFAFDTAAGLNHRLASITAYSGLNGAGTAFTTTYTHDVNDLSGTMAITRVDLPDGSYLAHEYDAPATAPNINFGFRTKTTRTKGANSLVLYDAEYEFFYLYQEVTTRLFHRPRIVKQRDGRGAISEVTFDYENGDTDGTGDTLPGEQSNFLLGRIGPTITLGTSGTRTPQTLYTYSSSQRTLIRQETRFGSGVSDFFRTDYTYDSLLRLASQAVDPLVVNSVTQYAYCDTAATQDRITADPDGYWTRRRFDGDGRVTFEHRFLNANPGNIATPCVDPSGPFYQTQYVYDTNGRLFQQVADNKDQAGVPLSPATITTQFTYDRLGRLTLCIVDPGGIGSESNFDFDWQGGIEREFDTSGRGITRTFEGRGLIDSETPLALNETPDNNLTTTYTYDSLGNRRFTNLLTGAVLETAYDDFSRIFQQKRTPGPDGGNEITTTYTYDDANNVTQVTVDEAAIVLSESTALFDEGDFNYESRQRLVAGVDGSDDPVTQRKFDWAGNITEERSFGDLTVSDRVVTAHFDGANRVDMVTDSEGGQTTFVRDDRGNVTDQTLMLNATDNAVTTTEYDALSRAWHITGPEDSVGGRPDRVRSYDSRGNLLRETLRDAADVPKMTSVFGYDNAGRQTRQAVLANAASTVDASSASVTTDRVADFQYDADGRLTDRISYNNGFATALTTHTEYDSLGRVDTVTDPSNSSTDDNYATNGRLDNRVVNDGVGSRSFTYAYDGHDRVIGQTAVGTPNLVTSFTLDGFDRQISVTDPRGLITATDYDLAGRRIMLTEDAGGAQQRQTSFDYNRLSQLTTQTAMNATSAGGALADQLTRFRYDSLGRMIRTLYPDNTTDVSELQIANCTDCMRMEYDDGGRMISRTEQRGLVSTMTYDKRSLLLTRTTDVTPDPDPVDTFNYDALGRTHLAQHGTTLNLPSSADDVSSSTLAYTDMGDLDHETQTLFEGTPRLVDYGYDQAGNRTQTTYPSGVTLAYTPTAINQVGAMSLDGNALVNYTYVGGGHVLQKRRTTTTAVGGNTYYDYEPGFDSHRRVGSITNSVIPGGGPPQTVARYDFTRDNNANPLTQTASGLAEFSLDDRAFTTDRLNRLTAAEYTAQGGTESVVLDRQGNRESYTDRNGTPTAYILADAANEYATIGGQSVQYDDAGNLTVDEDGRQYSYDEHNRLTQVKASDGTTVLADYAYDGLGRRVRAVLYDPDTTTTRSYRYYYDGPNVIEERDDADVRLAYHVHGGQYIDERVATYNEASSSFGYYLHNDLYTVAGLGDADGNLTAAFQYSAYGLPAVVGGGVACTRGDVNNDSFVDGLDIAAFVDVILGIDTDPVHVCAADIDGDGDVDWTDLELLEDCLLWGTCDWVCLPGDLDADSVVDLADLPQFVAVLLTDTGTAQEVCASDLNRDGYADGLDIQLILDCLTNADCPPAPGGGGGGGPATTNNAFFLHGSSVDQLDRDANGVPGLLLQYNRARYYDLKNARWLQRDPSGYRDGGNLYESFRNNPARLRDPLGEGVIDDVLDLLYRYGTNEGIEQTLDEQMGIRPLDPFTQAMRDRERMIIGTLGPPARRITEMARQVAVRGGGGLSAGGGAGEATIGVVLIAPSFGASSVFVAHGADVAQAGVRQAATGEPVPTFTYEIIAESGHPTVALVVDLGTSLASGGAGLLAPARAVPAALRGATAAGELASEARVSTQAVPILTRLGNANQRVVAIVFDAKPGEVVLGSGLSPGAIPGKQLVFPFAEAEALTAMNQPPGSARVYSVAFQAVLPENLYPGFSRATHFQQANRIFLVTLEADPLFAQQVETLIPGVRHQLVGPWGGISRHPPEWWTWHHSTEAGVMQLVPRAQHTPGSVTWDVLHPGGQGGYSLWGQ